VEYKKGETLNDREKGPNGVRPFPRLTWKLQPDPQLIKPLGARSQATPMLRLAPGQRLKHPICWVPISPAEIRLIVIMGLSTLMVDVS
jgi:hypothetical protein